MRCRSEDLLCYPTTPFPWARSLQQAPSDVRMGDAMCQHLAVLEQVDLVKQGSYISLHVGCSLA